MTALTNDANCTLLVNLARMAHKYQFRSIETWVLSAVHSFYSRPGAFDPVPTTTPPTLPPTAPASTPPSLEQLTELAALCERPDLLELAIARWKKQIGEGRDLALAINISERLNLRPVLGLAYHAMMLKGRAHWEAEPTLARDQRARSFGLLAGQPTFTVSSLQAKLDAQLRGLGVGFLPESLARPHLQAGRLVARRIERGSYSSALHYAWRASAVPGRALSWWLERLERPITRRALLGAPPNV